MFFAFTLTVLITAPYLNVSAMEMKDSMMKKVQMMKKDHMDSPNKQMEMGVADHDIQCKADYKLVFKSTDWSSACVKHSSVVSLVQRGWAASEEEMMSMEKEMMNDESMMKDESMMEDKEHMG